MKASSLDLLEKSQLPAGQVRAILQVMETELAARNDMLATRADLFAVKAEMATKTEVHGLELKVEGLRTDMHAMRAELLRWNFAFWVAQLASMAAMLKLMR